MLNCIFYPFAGLYQSFKLNFVFLLFYNLSYCSLIVALVLFDALMLMIASHYHFDSHQRISRQGFLDPGWAVIWSCALKK